jgi:hypothetical protein
MLHTTVSAAYICGCRILVDNAYRQVSCERDPAPRKDHTLGQSESYFRMVRPHAHHEKVL